MTAAGVLMGSGKADVGNPLFKTANTALGNIKSAINATYRTGGTEHMPDLFIECEHGLNRRYDLSAGTFSPVTHSIPHPQCLIR
jgi:hypothetical protein